MMLFNLDTDPGESTDVAAGHPDIVAHLSTLMAEAHTPSSDFPLPTIDD
jgi:hypothetical protein